jgi:hypothetical protein
MKVLNFRNATEFYLKCLLAGFSQWIMAGQSQENYSKFSSNCQLLEKKGRPSFPGRPVFNPKFPP